MRVSVCVYIYFNLQLTISKYVEWLGPQQSIVVQHLPYHSEVEGLFQMSVSLTLIDSLTIAKGSSPAENGKKYVQFNSMLLKM